MVWLYIVLAMAAVTTALLEFYVRFLPVWRENRKRKLEDKEEIRSFLDMAIFCVESYGSFSASDLDKLVHDAHIPKRLRKELGELVDFALERNRWRYECHQIINSEARAQTKHLDTLNRAFKDVIGSTLEGAFQGTEGSASDNIYKAIYKNSLTFEMAKESVLKDHWDAKVTIRDKLGEERELMFKDIIDGGEFHKFIENLIKLQNRTSIRTLRDAQARFLKKAQSILQEVT